MNIQNLKESIDKMDDWYHKLIYLVDRNGQFRTHIPLLDEFKTVNVNRVVSENLVNVPRQKYPLYIVDIFQDVLRSKENIYILEHIDILFDPQLKINPIRLLENLSKTYKLIVEWPGRYVENQLIYAEHGHQEYFLSEDYEGQVYIK